MMPFNLEIDWPMKRFTPIARDTEIAELFGIYAGDGCLGVYKSNTYRFTVAGGAEDYEYLKTVSNIVQNRFKVVPKLKKRFFENRKWIELVCCSKNIVEYFSKNGYPPGRKTDLAIPDWIKANPEFSAAFLRGLFDTDGYFILLPKGRLKAYPKFTFQMKPKRIIQEVSDLLQNLGFTPSTYLDSIETDARNGKRYEKNYAYLNGWKNFLLWKEKVGSSNIKNQTKLATAFDIWTKASKAEREL